MSVTEIMGNSPEVDSDVAMIIRTVLSVAPQQILSVSRRVMQGQQTCETTVTFATPPQAEDAP